MPGSKTKVAPSESRVPSTTSILPINADTLLETPNFTPLFNVQNDLAEWIPKHIHRRVCSKFVTNQERGPAKDGDTFCFCGYKRRDHITRALHNAGLGEDSVWKVNVNTEPKPTDAYGELEFVSFGGKVSKYVRVDHNHDTDRMLTLMLDHWKLEPPNLLISVTGGAKNFAIRPRLKEVFRRGLMKAADSTGAWIITGGMHAGVMKHVGEAVRDYTVAHGNKKRVVAIGIATWGCVSNKKSLINPELKGSWPAEYREVEIIKKESPLDPNHSHFILVDNGTQHQYAVEIPFRASLESKIANTKTKNGVVTVPVVCVVLEGGPGTLETVKSAIQNGTPAVIVEGSGRAADILAYAYAKSSEEEVEVTDQFGRKHKKIVSIVNNDVREDVRRMIVSEWGERDIDLRMNWLKECLQRRDHMTVFRLDSSDSSNDIDLAILQAMLKVNKGQSLDQLKLALAWNRIDVAKSEIFTDDTKWKEGELNEVMYAALLNDRVDFVELLLENGVSLRNFLDRDTLLHLYNEIPENTALFQLLDKTNDARKFFTFEDIGSVIQELMGDFFHPVYLTDHRYKDYHFDPTIDEPANETTDVDDTAAVVEFDEPNRDLFILAVLLNRPEMARLFWEEGKEGIAAALTAQRLLKSMVHNTSDTELVKELNRHAEYFERLAVGVLSDCYSTDEKKAQLLLVREMQGFGRTTNVVLAVEADNKVFIAHAACQSLFNQIWMGRISLDTGTLKMWICIVLPALIFPLITFRNDDRVLTSDDPSKNSKMNDQSEYEMQRMNTMYDNGLTRKSSKEKLMAPDKRGKTEPEPPPKTKNEGTGLNFIQKFAHFYNAPVITFMINCAFYFFFLATYSLVLLTDFRQSTVTIKEWILIVWVFTLAVEELRQLLSGESRNVLLMWKTYISDVWNFLDVFTIVFFITGIILRFIPDCDNCFTAARIILAINLMTFFFRILHIFSVHKELGPKLVMIGRMMVDLAFFTIILMVFIIAYGLASQAILYPNTPFSLTLMKEIVRKPYWQMYGELFLEEIEGDNECSDDPAQYESGAMDRCPDSVGTYVVPILLGVYILITNVLMLNLLIAMFSYTFSMVQDKTDLHWNFQRYSLIKEYHDRPPIPPPFILISHIYMLIKKLLRKCCNVSWNDDDELRMTFPDSEEKQLILWENMVADEYVRKSDAMEKQQIDTRVKDTSERVETISHKVDEMAESNFMMQSTNSSSNSCQPRLPPVLDDRLSYLEEQMKRTAKALDWIIDVMVDKGHGGKQAPALPDVDQLREEAKKKRAEEVERRKEEFKHTLERELELHVKARTIQYPCPNVDQVYRCRVPDDKVSWNIAWAEYAPKMFTDPTILTKSWADIDLLTEDPTNRSPLPFNQMDDTKNVNRTSYLGEYEVHDGIPRNPQGRTGLCGRGVLGHWGPNHAGDPIVTRWALDEKKDFVKSEGKKLLEFVAIQREDNGEWAIPGSILEPGEEVYTCLKAEFIEEAVGSLIDDPAKQQVISEKLNKLFQNKKDVYRGYVDDPRNTDNAWLETTAVNYHDETGTILNNFEVRAGKMVQSVGWQKITSKHSLYAAHQMILQKVATLHGAAF